MSRFRTHVEFRSDAFAALPGEDDQVNPGRWGKALAEYLQGELRTRGLPAGEPYPEDWGWAIPIEHHAFPLWVGCGNYEEHADGYLCFIEPGKPVVRRWFRAIDTTAVVTRVADALDAALRASGRARDIRWWDET